MTRKRPGFVEEERSWGSWGLLLAGIGFAAGAVLNLGTGAFANAAVGALIGAFGIGSWWLYDEAEAVRNGGATSGGIPITGGNVDRVGELLDGMGR